MDSVTRNRFLGREFNLWPGSLKPLAALEQTTVLQVSCDRKRWTSVGGRMSRTDRDRALAFGDGVFFELTRDRHLRALAQEPFGRLDL